MNDICLTALGLQAYLCRFDLSARVYQKQADSYSIFQDVTLEDLRYVADYFPWYGLARRGQSPRAQDGFCIT